MTNPNSLDIMEVQGEGSSLAPWQQFLRRWQGPIAFGPFATVLFITMKFFPNANANWYFVCLLVATVVWPIIIVGYALYLKYLE